MNRFPAYVAIILGAVAVSGCCPNGCFVLTGDAYRALAFPEPIRKRWVRADTDDIQRQADWFECGGSETGNFAPESTLVERVQKERGVSELATHRFLFHEVQRCMLRKGYQYTGKCDLDVLKAMPACGAP